MRLPTPSLAAAVAALKEYLTRLSKRPDLTVTVKQVGRPLRAAAVAGLRARPDELPAELVDFYELLNGVHVEWTFIGGGGSGGLRLPAYGGYTTFETDQKNYNSFGPGKMSLLCDGVRGEYGTWYVAQGLAGRAGAELRFAFQGENDRGFVVAGSLAEYLQQGIAAGFVDAWPLAARGDEGVAEQIARFQAPPVKPAKIRPGTRVHSVYFSEGCRGEVVRLHHFNAPTELSEFLRVEAHEPLALVRLDLGVSYWMFVKRLKAVAAVPDLYEQLHADPALLLRWGRAEGWAPALRRLTVLLGPLTSYSGFRAGNSRLAAALLQALPAADAAELVRELVAGVEAVRDELAPVIEPTEAERLQVFCAADWRARSWQAHWEDTLIMLVAGLVERLQLASDAARATVPFATIDGLLTTCRTQEVRQYAIVLKQLIVNEHDERDAYETAARFSPALPEPYPVASGSGF